MNARLWSLACLLTLALAAPLHAQSQHELNEEAAREAARADKVLNQVYKQVLAACDAEGAKLLKESQRAWIAYRDAEASVAADEARGGSMAPMLYSYAIASLTDERVKRLKKTLEGGNEGPDTSEPPAKPGRRSAPEPEPEAKPEPRSKNDAPATADKGAAGASTRRQAAQYFFEAYRKHDRQAAAAVASERVLNKLVWNKQAGENESLKLMDDSHIYYEGGSIQLKFEKTKDGRWIVSDVGMTAD